MMNGEETDGGISLGDMEKAFDFDSTWDARILYYTAFLRGVVTYGREFGLEWKQFHYKRNGYI